ncbi:hypothetical protein FEDK69T_11860 [Flavobacterium enshiense DK69]|uniref:Outer membrane protein beta-barrel domain-containing protein n=1 Tax=Flavobacterium enshiense DK69 TaxID=1107311 RepID=V6SAU0_9FLAO|nr:outer membrane beta-barrel protein [Flavobacterium enshiense]ESU23778.1 hypothetical protein FEDK69T_11860 [Flavobacterium enshiense DK69]KGO96094.1 hypothetical protein Q767_07480 [Flavobacterium enshiense DK69]
MKKLIASIVFCFLGLTQMNAQVTFRPGIRGGLNFSHFTKGDNYYYYDNNGHYVNDERDFNSKTDFYVSFYGELKLSKVYTLQPEIGYSAQGSDFDYIDGNGHHRTETYDISYLSLGVANKFTFGKFNFHVGPTMDFVVSDNFKPDSDVDMAFFLGAGYNFTKNFGIEARIKKGIIPVVDFYEDNRTNVVFQTGVTYTFDVK